jgi:hypothetical protein
MTEVVLLFPMFMVIVFITAKMFALLVLVQKMEIASYYAARRWQLESHRNVSFHGRDGGGGGGCGGELCHDIERMVRVYLYDDDDEKRKYLGIKPGGVTIGVDRTQVWNIVTLKVEMEPIKMVLIEKKLNPFQVTKYVPNRDRPIQFVLPGLGP